MPTPIRPGIVGDESAAALSALVDRNARNANDLDEFEKRLHWRDRFPAAVTAIDRSYNPPRYSWYEQDADANGNRTPKVAGRTGTATKSPAFAYGDGTHFATVDLPMPVTMVRRCVAGTLGPVYEFPVYCACLGSGSGDGYALVPCCPNPIPRTLTATVSVPGCACLDGQTFSMTYVAGLDTWAGRFDSVCFPGDPASTFTFDLVCNLVFFPPSGWFTIRGTFGGAGTNHACNFDNTGGTITFSCDPFFYQETGTIGSSLLAAPCDCDGVAWTLTITE